MNWFKRLFRKRVETPKSDYSSKPKWVPTSLKPPADNITFTTISLDSHGNVIRHVARGTDMYGNVVYQHEEDLKNQVPYKS